MFHRNWKKEVFTIPNLLSFFRLVLVPLYAVLYLNAEKPQQFFLSGSIMAVSCMTDLLDGKIARKYNMVSTLGKILDPVADKVTQFVLMLCLSIKYPILRNVLELFLVKEIFQAVLGILNLRKGKILSGALMAGKISTTVLFVTLTSLVLLPHMPRLWVNTIALADCIFLTVSFLSYILVYSGNNQRFEQFHSE